MLSFSTLKSVVRRINTLEPYNSDLKYDIIQDTKKFIIMTFLLLTFSIWVGVNEKHNWLNPVTFLNVTKSVVAAESLDLYWVLQIKTKMHIAHFKG